MATIYLSRHSVTSHDRPRHFVAFQDIPRQIEANRDDQKTHERCVMTEDFNQKLPMLLLHGQSKIARIRQIYPAIMAAHSNGVSYTRIAALLRQTGIEVNDNDLRSMIRCIKASQKNPQPAGHRKPPAVAATQTSNPSQILSLLQAEAAPDPIYDRSTDEVGLTRRQRSEKLARQYIPDHPTHPRLLQKLQKQKEGQK